MALRKKSVFHKQVASYFISFLHANVTYNEVPVCCPDGLYLVRGACMSLIEGSF